MFNPTNALQKSTDYAVELLRMTLHVPVIQTGIEELTAGRFEVPPIDMKDRRKKKREIIIFD